MLNIKKLRIKNFISVGDNFLDIQLDKSPTTIITGSNGNGKSIMLDAITFVLFGKSYRGINKSAMVNSVNQKDCVIELYFNIGTAEYIIIRGMSPSVFSIYEDGKLIDNAASARDHQKMLENTILHCNYNAFCQICLLGTANYVPFMQLDASSRRDVIETLLDISVFSEMNRLLKMKITSWKDEYSSLKEKIAVSEKELKLRKEFYNDVLNSTGDRIAQKRESLNALKKRATGLSDQRSIIVSTLAAQTKDMPLERLREAIEDKSNATSESGSLKSRLSMQKKKLEFFQDNSTCPTCDQEIDEEHKHHHVEDLEKSTATTEIDVTASSKLISELTSKIELIEQKRSKISGLEKEISSYDSRMSSLADNGRELISEIKGLEASDTSKLSDAKDKITESSTELRMHESERKELLEKKEIYSHAQLLLKDGGIKSSIIRQYLPVLNSRVNHYLGILGLNVQFELDESFNETLKARYKNEFTYSNFSMGERQRLDLALTFAWRDIAKMKNSVNTNLLIFDEIFDSSLDEDGTYDLLTILNEVSEDTNIFIISHKGGMEDKFRSSIQFEKHNGFTRIAAP